MTKCLCKDCWYYNIFTQLCGHKYGPTYHVNKRSACILFEDRVQTFINLSTCDILSYKDDKMKKD